MTRPFKLPPPAPTATSLPGSPASAGRSHRCLSRERGAKPECLPLLLALSPHPASGQMLSTPSSKYRTPCTCWPETRSGSSRGVNPLASLSVSAASSSSSAPLPSRLSRTLQFTLPGTAHPQALASAPGSAWRASLPPPRPLPPPRCPSPFFGHLVEAPSCPVCQAFPAPEVLIGVLRASPSTSAE